MTACGSGRVISLSELESYHVQPPATP